MKKGYKRLLFFTSIIIIILFINTFVGFFSKYKIDLFLGILLIIFHKFFVIEKDKHRYIKDVLFEILFFVVLYFILYYLMGLAVGLARTQNYLTFNGLKNFIVPIILYSILRETFRYNMLCKAEGSNICTVTIVILFILMDLSYNTVPTSFASAYDLLKYVALTLLPVISRNISYSYVSRKLGYRPVIIFDLIFSLYPYFIPILPDPSEYIVSIIYLIVPVLFAFRILKFLDYKKDSTLPSDYHKKRFKGILLPIAVTFVMIFFYSGYFRFYAIAIASGSMEPNIHIGDVVIVDQEVSRESLEEGDVIAFRHNDVVVVHRIYKKVKLDGKNMFYTKGDANNKIDDFLTEEESIVGKVDTKVPFIGYPTVWLNKER